eukprot:Rhum_TRINITY_DN14230_c6_g2::Rhum_TRINITY_DN14230_c6_g2_i1::g.75041::m.75041
MAGGNPVRAQARKKKRHEVSVELPASVLELVRELEAAAAAETPADAVQAAVLRDVARLAAAERVDEQSRIVSAWGTAVFGTESLARGASASASSSASASRTSRSRSSARWRRPPRQSSSHA